MNSGLFGIPTKVINSIRVIITNLFPTLVPLTIKAAPNQTAAIVQVNSSVDAGLFSVDPPLTGTTAAITLGQRNDTSNGLKLVVTQSPTALGLFDAQSPPGLGNAADFKARKFFDAQNGSYALDGANSVLDIGSTFAFRFSSTSASSGTKDVGFVRTSAGIIKVTNGSSGQGGIVADTLSDVSNSVQLDYAGGSGKIRLASGAAIAFHTTTIAAGADVGFIRDSAGIVRVTNGTTGDGKILHKGMQVREGSNQTMGLSVLVGGTVTVNTTQVTANSRIFLTIDTPSGTLGFVYISARVAGTSFTITSSSAIDTSSVAWLIVEPA